MKDWLNKCHFGDVRSVLIRMIADGVKVNTIITSPPYWGLRSYLPEGHPDKKHEIGSEPTLAEFIAGMVEVFNLCREVLHEDGTMWVNMGDSYAGSRQGPQGDSPLAQPGHQGGGKKRAMTDSRRRDNEPIPRSDVRTPGLKPKDLVGQPWRLAFALQDAGWWLRQDIIWHKPNPMPESTRDRCTKAHEYIFLLSKSERYYYDFDSMQEPVNGGANARGPGNKKLAKGAEQEEMRTRTGLHTYAEKMRAQNAPAPSHALFDGEDPTPDVGRIYAGNGVGFGHGYDKEPKPRVTGRTPAGWATGTDRKHDETEGRYSEKRKLAAAGSGTKNNSSMDAALSEMVNTRNRRSVWTVPSEPYSGAHFATYPRKLIEPCVLAGCPPGGVVLDIFFGSGTTGQVAQALGRNFIGIELNAANEALQAERLSQRSLVLEA